MAGVAKMKPDALRETLEGLAEEEYRRFNQKLIPGAENILGVRIPALRKIAKTVAQGDWQDYLATAQADWLEEVLLQGLVIGYAAGGAAERLPYIAAFIPKINNWAVCDTFCANLHLVKENKKIFLDFLIPYLTDEGEFEVRFAVVLLLCYYSTAADIPVTLALLETVGHRGYYAKMATAWAVSVCYVHDPEATLPFLQNNRLDDFTHNKALQKIAESNRVDRETKQRLSLLKRLKRLKQK